MNPNPAKSQPDPDVELQFVGRSPQGDLWLEPFPEPPPPPARPNGRRRGGRGSSYDFDLRGSFNMPEPTESGKAWASGFRTWAIVFLIALSLIGGTYGVTRGMYVGANVSPAPVYDPMPTNPDYVPVDPTESATAAKLRQLYNSSYRWVMDPADIAAIEEAYFVETGKHLGEQYVPRRTR